MANLLKGKQIQTQTISINGSTGHVRAEGDLDMSTYNVVVSSTPTLGSHAANKAYVDALANGLRPHAPAIVVATTTVASLSGTTTIDTIGVVEGNRVLLTNQGGTGVGDSHVANGLWVVHSGSTGWTRPLDADGTPDNEVSLGDFVFIEQGSVNASSGWVLAGTDSNSDNNIIPNVEAQKWVKMAAPGAFSADGQGIELNGNVFSLELDGTSLSKSATGLMVSTGYTSSISTAIANGDSSVVTALSTSISSGNASLSSAISSEASTRTGADTSLSTAISSSNVGNTSLSTAISSEISTRTGADTSLSTAISSEASTRTAGDGSLSTALSSEISTRTGADTSLSTAISSSNVGNTSLSTALSSEISTRTGADTSLSTAVSSEVSTRTAADTSLSTAISSINLSDGSLSTAISSEISTRTAADGSLSTAISSEASTRTGADTSLSTAISSSNVGNTSLSTALSSEISTRTAADGSLSTAISSEASTRTGADTSLSTAVSSEVSTRTAADTSLSTAISSSNVGNTSLSTALSSEISTRTAGDGSLSTALSSEISTRTAADTSLSTAIAANKIDVYTQSFSAPVSGQTTSMVVSNTAFIYPTGSTIDIDSVSIHLNGIQYSYGTAQGTVIFYTSGTPTGSGQTLYFDGVAAGFPIETDDVIKLIFTIKG